MPNTENLTCDALPAVVCRRRRATKARVTAEGRAAFAAAMATLGGEIRYTRECERIGDRILWGAS